MDVDQFKKAVFMLPHRRFGAFTQLMVQKLFSLTPPQNNHHDFMHDIDGRVEAKFSVVRPKWNYTLTETNVFDCLKQTLEGSGIVPYKGWENYEFDCSMNHVKPEEFEALYYGLFFEDEVLIFKLYQWNLGPAIFYSDKQQKGNVEEGQFHINNKTLPIHVKNYLCKSLDYFELYDLFTSSSPSCLAP